MRSLALIKSVVNARELSSASVDAEEAWVMDSVDGRSEFGRRMEYTDWADG